MPRYTRNQAILAKIETTTGTDAAPAAATDALLVSNLQVKTYDAKYTNRNLMYPYFGSADDIPVYGYVSGSFDVELAGSGAAGTAPAWGKVLRMSAMAEVITAGSRVEYTPISTGMESATIYYYRDGYLRKALGCRATFKAGLKYGDIPKLSVSFTGLDGGDAVVANPSPVYSPWKTPLPVNQANSSKVVLGGTYATGAISGGTQSVTGGLEIDLGGKVVFTELIGGEAVDFVDRNVTGKIVIDADATTEKSNLDAIKAITKQSIGMVHGVAAGGRVLVYLPSCQLKSPELSDQNGRMLQGYEFMGIPINGNDELRIVAL
jgi:hypothetical protein